MKENNKPITKNIQEEGEEHSNNSIKNALKIVWTKLNRLKSRLGFQTLSDEFGEYLSIQDKYIRNKSNASIDNVLMSEIESDMESLLGRLEIYDSLDPNEVKMLKGVEKPITLFGRKIEFGNYKKVGRLVMYAGGIYIGYIFLFRPIIFPMMKKVLSAKVNKRDGRGSSDKVKNADYRVI